MHPIFNGSVTLRSRTALPAPHTAWDEDVEQHKGESVQTNRVETEEVQHVQSRRLNSRRLVEQSPRIKIASWLPPMRHRTREFSNGLTIHLDGRLLASETGGDCWLGSIAVSRLLEANREWLSGKRVIELGAGTGFLSMSMLLLGAAACTCTDRGDMLDLMRRNAKANHQLLRQQHGATRQRSRART